MFALTRSNSSSRDAMSSGKRPLWWYLSGCFFILNFARLGSAAGRSGQWAGWYITKPPPHFFDGPILWAYGGWARYFSSGWWVIHTSTRVRFDRKHISSPYSPGGDSCDDSRKSWEPIRVGSAAAVVPLHAATYQAGDSIPEHIIS